MTYMLVYPPYYDPPASLSQLVDTNRHRMFLVIPYNCNKDVPWWRLGLAEMWRMPLYELPPGIIPIQERKGYYLATLPWIGLKLLMGNPLLPHVCMNLTTAQLTQVATPDGTPVTDPDLKGAIT